MAIQWKEGMDNLVSNTKNQLMKDIPCILFYWRMQELDADNGTAICIYSLLMLMWKSLQYVGDDSQVDNWLIPFQLSLLYHCDIAIIIVIKTTLKFQMSSDFRISTA